MCRNHQTMRLVFVSFFGCLCKCFQFGASLNYSICGWNQFAVFLELQLSISSSKYGRVEKSRVASDRVNASDCWQLAEAHFPRM